MSVDAPDDDDSTALTAPSRIAITLKGEAAAQLGFLAKRQDMPPSGIVRELVGVAYRHVRDLEQREQAQAKADADRAEAERLKSLQRQIRAASIERRAAALSEVAALKGVEICGARFRAFTVNKRTGIRSQIGTYATATEAGLAHDGALWETLIENAVTRAPQAADPTPDDFNWPLRDDYLTPNDERVEECRRTYFHSKLSDGQYPPRGFLRPGVDDALIEHMERVTDHDETGRDDRGREEG